MVDMRQAGVQGYSWKKLVPVVVLKVLTQRPTHPREILLLLLKVKKYHMTQRTLVYAKPNPRWCIIHYIPPLSKNRIGRRGLAVV
jgi:hypothetical protein